MKLIPKAKGGLSLFSSNDDNDEQLLDKLAVYYVDFPEYEIGMKGALPGFAGETLENSAGNLKLPLGHAGVLTIDKNGVTRYYEYGRYNNTNLGVQKDGNFRRKSVPNYTGLSAKKFKLLLEQKFGLKVDLYGAKDADINAVHDFINTEANDKNRDDYNILTNTCGSKAYEACLKGKSKGFFGSVLDIVDGLEFTPSSYGKLLSNSLNYKKY